MKDERERTVYRENFTWHGMWQKDEEETELNIKKMEMMQ